MSIFNLFSLLGGLALFLYGMNVMGDSLEKLAGGRLESILQKLTSNYIKAVLLGAGVTAIIQSSSAVTVMVVGLVNSGIMQLQQVVGVIMGANVGTTITSWILSLTGIESSNLILNLFKPSSFAPVLAFIGVIMVMASKKDKVKTVGLTMLGFAILMIGMEYMSDSLSPLAEEPAFRELFVAFTNPIIGLLAGTILTAIIQSSSASVGILQALSMTGAVSFGAAIPIIMGQNIGTCITAILSSIGTNKNARRTSLIHLYFNIIGTVAFMIVFYALHSMIHFSFLKENVSPVDIAIIHSVFNIVAVIILSPFKNVLIKLAYITIPDSPEDKDVIVSEIRKPLLALEPRFLERPSFAMEQSRQVLHKMVDLVADSIYDALDLLVTGYEEEKASRVDMLEGEVDRYEDVIGTYLLQLSRKDLTDKEGRLLNLYLKTINDLERISDHARNLRASARDLYASGGSIPSIVQEELKVYASLLEETMKRAFRVLKELDGKDAYGIEPLEQTVDIISKELKERYVERLKTGEVTPQLGFAWSDIITNIERVSDHCSNIGVNIIEWNKKGLNIHSRLEQIKEGKGADYEVMVSGYLQKYALPEGGK